MSMGGSPLGGSLFGGGGLLGIPLDLLRKKLGLDQEDDGDQSVSAVVNQGQQGLSPQEEDLKKKKGIF